MEAVVLVVDVRLVQLASTSIRELVIGVSFAAQPLLVVAVRIALRISIGMKPEQVDVVIAVQQVTVADVHTVRRAGMNIDFILMVITSFVRTFRTMI